VKVGRVPSLTGVKFDRCQVLECSCESWPGAKLTGVKFWSAAVKVGPMPSLTGVKFDRCQVLECSCESWPGAKFDRCQV
jgi:hypothetical protein